jgi:ankyrin repeat protein
VVDQDGFSALTWAARMGFVHLAAYLVEKGSEIDLCDVEGKSPLYWGCFSRQADVARMLVARGARPDLCSKTGWSPLLLCAYRGYTDILAILLAAAPGSVDKRHPQGLRPLRLAIHWNHIDTVQLLLSAGADPLKVGREGRNALEEAVLMGREECVRLLQVRALVESKSILTKCPDVSILPLPLLPPGLGPALRAAQGAAAAAAVVRVRQAGPAGARIQPPGHPPGAPRAAAQPGDARGVGA